VRGYVASANVSSRAALLPFVLRTGGVGQQVPRNAKSEQKGEQGDNILHVCPPEKLWYANGQGFLNS